MTLIHSFGRLGTNLAGFGTAALRPALALTVAFSVAPAAAQGPERFSATYGSWELRCGTLADAAGATTEACEIVQAIQVQGQAQPLTQIAIGSPAPDADFIMVLQLPVGIWLPAGASIEVTEGETLPSTLKRCVPSACLAELAFTAELREKLSANPDGEGRILFASDENQPAAVPILFRGFEAAFAALTTRLSTAAAE